MATIQEPPAPPTSSRMAGLLRPSLGKILTLIVAAGLGWETYHIVLGTNLHTVVPGQMYRCAQPSAAFLEDAIPRYGIRTVINLRGYNPSEPWCQEECAALERLGVPIVHVAMTAAAPTEEADFHKMIQVLDATPGPLLIHCMGGNDRSGVAATAYLLLKTDATPAAARRQLSLRYGHFPWGRAGCQHEVLDLYDTWLREQKLEHTNRRFYHWGTKVFHYDGGPLTKNGPRPTNRTLDLAELRD